MPDAPRGRWRRRSRASRGPGGRAPRSRGRTPRNPLEDLLATAAGSASAARTSRAAAPSRLAPVGRKLLLAAARTCRGTSARSPATRSAAEELASVPAEPRVQRPVRLERVERLDELLVALVVQPGVAADALAVQDVAVPLASTGRPSAHASSATIDRLSKYDGMISRSAAASAVELVAIVEEAQMVDARVLRHVDDRRCRPGPGRGRAGRPRRSAGSARRARRSPCSRRCGRCRSRTAADLELAPEALRVGALRHVRADADDDAGDRGVAGRRLDHRALLRRVVHERAHAAEAPARKSRGRSPDRVPRSARGPPCPGCGAPGATRGSSDS